MNFGHVFPVFGLAMPLWPWLLFSLGASDPQVTAPAGQVRGIREGEVHVFRGIPYAQAPVGELRWRPPNAMKPWSGIRDASIYGSYCMSTNNQVHGGSEDCLYLNIYTPQEATNTSQLPCLVWIHGGGFEIGSSNLYNGTSLVNLWRSQQSPGVLVTINYRLNVFGFLGSEKLRDRDELRSTGNYGIQDQRLALRWVQENIAAFGGDPKKVMIFGQSAGAGAVSVHLSMPKSFGLYSSAIMESGGFSGWTAQPMVRKELWFQRLMNHTLCHDVQCLLNLPADELFAAYRAIPHGQCCGHLFAKAFIPWAPTIDGVELTAHPFDLLKEDKVNKVPTIIGSTLDDGAMFFEENFNMTAEDFLPFFQKEFNASQKEAELYSSETHPFLADRGEGWWSAERVVTDQNFFCTSDFARRSLAASEASAPVFGYVFAHSSSGLVVSHCAELPFVFQNLASNASSEEKQLASEVAMSWYRFAASGQPDVAWPQQSAKASPIMKFQVSSQGGNHIIDGDYRAQQCAFMLGWLNRSLHKDRTRDITTLWPIEVEVV